ncbi:hypothetical protein BGW80DRAFT_1266892 [Lactifluus volemus]|nr:hypothetical protein BGW80DRAFT_1266892 [Lactifluus volemus]
MTSTPYLRETRYIFTTYILLDMLDVRSAETEVVLETYPAKSTQPQLCSDRATGTRVRVTSVCRLTHQGPIEVQGRLE